MTAHSCWTAFGNLGNHQQQPLIRAKISHLSLAVTVKGWWNPDAILTWQNPNMVELVVSTQRWGDLTYQNGIFHQPDIGVGINSAGHFEPTGFVQKYGGWSYFFAGTALLPTMGHYHLAITVLISLCGTSTVTGSFALHCQLGEL